MPFPESTFVQSRPSWCQAPFSDNGDSVRSNLVVYVTPPAPESELPPLAGVPPALVAPPLPLVPPVLLAPPVELPIPPTPPLLVGAPPVFARAPPLPALPTVFP